MKLSKPDKARSVTPVVHLFGEVEFVIAVLLYAEKLAAVEAPCQSISFR